MAREKGTSAFSAHSRRRPYQVDHYINQFLDATCDESRRAILELLVPPDGQDSPEAYELRAGDIARQLGLARSTTSEHLHQLLKMHLVSTRREGTMVYYRLRNRHLVRAFHELLRALETHYTAQSAAMESPTAAGE
ncbi:MAG TPA: metalloregulator ArsR/SmtB family transcription factor [Ktedonobacteraceae bacterium]|nr:metalloregulator ArsR/SmtB family transcription factor [Ktedonobacteraceae bacterium]